MKSVTQKALVCLLMLVACTASPGQNKPVQNTGNAGNPPKASASPSTAATASGSLVIDLPRQLKADQSRIQLKGKVTLANGSVSDQITWSISSSDLARLEEDQYLVPLKPGSLIVTAVAKTDVRITARIQVEIEALTASSASTSPTVSPTVKPSASSSPSPSPSSSPVASGSPSPSASASPVNCASPLATPTISIARTISQPNGTMYAFVITSTPAYPNEFFQALPVLGSCGSTTATRARINVFAANNQSLAVFCDISKLKSDGVLFFSLTTAQQENIKEVYATVEDRACGRSAKSSVIRIEEASPSPTASP
ncbi:MAG: hypothetical protein ACAI44_22335 [Candidatus Sericytochromatia bacterium]